jgi:hypothetical protein
MADSNLLDSIFSAKDDDVETFADVMKAASGKNITEQESIRLKKTSNMHTETQRLISIMHGTHEDNYVWHIRPAHKKRPWAVDLNRVLFGIGKVLNEYVPNDVLIDIHLPNPQWQIEEITVKANEAMVHWAVSDDVLKKVTGQFFEVLNTLV